MSGRIALGLVLIGAGILWVLTEADVIDLAVRTWVGILLIAIGCAIAFSSRHRRLLVLAGIVVALLGLPVLLVDEDLFEGGVGDTVETPTSSADVEPYRLGIGKLTLDLTDTGLELDGSLVEASVGIGDLLVIVPTDTDYALDAHVGVGNAEALDERESGVDVDLELISGTSGSQEIGLELDVGIGNLRVERE
jgi:predicted membrane protein